MADSDELADESFPVAPLDELPNSCQGQIRGPDDTGACMHAYADINQWCCYHQLITHLLQAQLHH